MHLRAAVLLHSGNQNDRRPAWIGRVRQPPDIDSGGVRQRLDGVVKLGSPLLPAAKLCHLSCRTLP